MNAISPGNRQLSRRDIIAAARRAGGLAGRDAADWWAQDTVGGRAPAHHSAPTARRILTALADGDPAVYDDLPVPTVSEVADAHDEAAPPCAASWHHVPALTRETFDAAYTNAYTTAVTTRITRICRHTLTAAESSGDHHG